MGSSCSCLSQRSVSIINTLHNPPNKNRTATDVGCNEGGATSCESETDHNKNEKIIGSWHNENKNTANYGLDKNVSTIVISDEIKQNPASTPGFKEDAISLTSKTSVHTFKYGSCNDSNILGGHGYDLATPRTPPDHIEHVFVPVSQRNRPKTAKRRESGRTASGDPLEITSSIDKAWNDDGLSSDDDDDADVLSIPDETRGSDSESSSCSTLGIPTAVPTPDLLGEAMDIVPDDIVKTFPSSQSDEAVGCSVQSAGHSWNSQGLRVVHPDHMTQPFFVSHVVDVTADDDVGGVSQIEKKASERSISSIIIGPMGEMVEYPTPRSTTLGGVPSLGDVEAMITGDVMYRRAHGLMTKADFEDIVRSYRNILTSIVELRLHKELGSKISEAAMVPDIQILPELERDFALQLYNHNSSTLREAEVATLLNDHVLKLEAVLRTTPNRKTLVRENRRPSMQSDGISSGSVQEVQDEITQLQEQLDRASTASIDGTSSAASTITNSDSPDSGSLALTRTSESLATGQRLLLWIIKTSVIAAENHRQLSALVRDLTDGCSCGQERVESMYSWLVTQDLAKYREVLQEEAGETGVLLHRLANSHISHAEVFQMLCRHADVACHVVSGFVKSDDYRPGDDVFTENRRHTWNVVVVDNKRLLLDTKFGSQTQKYCREHFLFTPPNLFVLTHFPDINSWQYPEREIGNSSLPISRGIFVEMLKIYPPLFLFDIRPLNTKSCARTYDGKFCVTFSLKNQSVLSLLEYMGPGAPVDPSSLAYYVDQYTNNVNNEEAFHLSLPTEGVYYFTLLVNDPFDENDIPVCQYKITYKDELL